MNQNEKHKKYLNTSKRNKILKRTFEKSKRKIIANPTQKIKKSHNYYFK